MAEAVLQFTLRAKDEASRVVSAVTGRVKDDVKALDSTVGKLAKSFGFSDSKAAALAKTLPLVGAGIGAVAGVATAAGAAIFALTKSASDAGSEIFEAGQKSNLSAEFLSVLKVQAEQSGSSFDGATGKVTKWGSALVDAAKGKKELIADLKRFGIDAAEAYRNPEAALKTFIEAFNRLPPSAANNAAAMRLFKDRSGEIIPVLRAFGTDYEGLVRKLDASGQIWTQEGVEKADEFGDALTELGQVATGIGNVFAREVMPDITDAMKDISKAITENRNTVREWGRDVMDVLRGVREVLNSDFAAGFIRSTGAILQATTPLIPILQYVGAQSRGTTELSPNDPGQRFGGQANAPMPGQPTSVTTPTAPADVVNEAAAKERARKLEAARKEELRLTEAIENAKERAHKKTIDAVRDAERDVLREMEEAKRESARLDREMADMRANASDRVRAAIRDEIAVITEENQHLRATNNLIREAEILGAIDARTAAFARQLAVVNELAKVAPDSDVLGGAAGALGVRDIPVGAGPRVDPATMPEPPAPTFDLWKESLSGLKDAAADAFGGVTQGMGSMVHALLMGEKLSGRAFAQMAKSAIASVAAEAGVRALFELAMGLASMWLNPAKAASHFAAAKVFGVVAGAAALATLAIPGGGGTGAADFGGSSAGGGFGSGRDERDRTISEPRRGGMSDPNQAQTMGYMMVDVKLDDNHVERKMVKVWRRMGEFRDTVMAGTVGTAPSY